MPIIVDGNQLEVVETCNIFGHPVSLHVTRVTAAAVATPARRLDQKNEFSLSDLLVDLHPRFSKLAPGVSCDVMISINCAWVALPLLISQCLRRDRPALE